MDRPASADLRGVRPDVPAARGPDMTAVTVQRRRFSPLPIEMPGVRGRCNQAMVAVLVVVTASVVVVPCSRRSTGATRR